MHKKFKSALTALAALGLFAGGITAPASAAGEAIDIVNSNNTRGFFHHWLRPSSNPSPWSYCQHGYTHMDQSRFRHFEAEQRR